VAEFESGERVSTAPTIMVSSTFYDLRQIRSDLAAFVSDALGYTVLLSEFPSFPVDPDLDTVENCKRRVEQNADILVLVVGGRYGSIDRGSDRSITNLEYLAARAKGIPIYAFVEKAILSVMPVWEQNPDGDFSNVVDTPRLFEFIKAIRDEDRVWVFSFEAAQDIVSALRIQLGHLFNESLQTRLRLLGTGGLPRYLQEASADTIRTALERPSGWEFLLFGYALADAVQRHSGLLREYKLGVRVGPAEAVWQLLAVEWMRTRMHELEGFADSATRLMNESLQSALGEPGQPGDPEHIVWVADQLGDLLREAITWSQRVRRAHVDEVFEDSQRILGDFASDLIERITEFPEMILTRMKDALKRSAQGQKGIELSLTLTLDLPGVDEFLSALEKAQREIG
jgi:hypothetical protein